MLYLGDFLFLFGQRSVNQLYVIVGQLLDITLHIAQLIFGKKAGMLSGVKYGRRGAENAEICGDLHAI